MFLISQVMTCGIENAPKASDFDPRLNRRNEMRTYVAILTALALVGSASYAFAMGGGGGRRGGGGGGGSASAAHTSNAFQVTHTPPSNVDLNRGGHEGNSGFDGQYGDQQQASAVPEPGTLLLLASGTAGLVSLVRRRK
jgi:hypothetical protein